MQTINKLLPLVSFFVSLIAVLIAVWGVYIARKEIEANRTWNGLLAASGFIDNSKFDALTDELDRELGALNIQYDTAVSSEDLQVIYAHRSAARALNRLLTYMERTSAMINAGAIDDELAYQFMYGQVVGVYDRFKRYISHRREQFNNDQEILGHLESLASRWRERKILRRASETKVSAQRRHGL